ncbi:MAG: hypothetical protein O9327_05880 [Polaromonas sp.]|nr:hypothetical protein [Polaromonas sp.]
MKSTRALVALFAIAASAGPAISAPATDPALAIWKDVASCMPEARGKVVSAKAAKVGGKAGVEITSKGAKSSKVLVTGIQGFKPIDFPVGSDFCKVDFGAD